jgi:predicted GTPase
MTTEITLRYNPFEAKASYSYKGKDKPIPKCMGSGENSRLQDWLYDFFPDLKDMYNWGEGAECTVSFHGTPGDFEDIEHARDIFIKENPGIEISLNHINPKSKTLDTRLSDLRMIFEKMQNESPYEELKDSILRPRFEQALSSEFEISVIATMSSGKSTLINAILGQEILPARNEATTAKIAQIHDVDDAKAWTVQGLKKDDKGGYVPATEEKSATLDELEKLNSDAGIEKIEIKGNIPGINSRQMRLLLSDTPGPNNSRTIEHAKHIDELIKADYKPMIMYILNATQLEITDDKSLLEKIAKAMEGNGKQASDRFLFVLNKADQLDPGKNEFIEKSVEDSKKYLDKQFGITGARIFPVSAQLAKVVRMSQAGRPLTEDEEDFLVKKNRFITRKERHLSDYVSLSPSCKKRQEEILQNAIAANDENTQALIYSGIPAIELAMDEYLEKYALTAKISKAVGVFINLVEKLGLENQTKEKLQADKDACKKTVSQFEKAIAQIKKGEKSKEMIGHFDNDIQGIKNELKQVFEQYGLYVSSFFANEQKSYGENEKPIEEARRIVDDTARQLVNNFSSLNNDLKQLIDKKLLKQSKHYLAEYKKYIEDLLKDNEGCILDDALNLVQINIPDNPETLIEQFKEVKESRIIVEADGPGGGIGRFFGDIVNFLGGNVDWGYEHRKRYEDIVNMPKLFENHLQPLEEQFLSDIGKAKKNAIDNTSELAKYFKGQLDRLDAAIKEKMQEQANLLGDKEKFEKSIDENQKRAEWLKNFRQKLDEILQV